MAFYSDILFAILSRIIRTLPRPAESSGDVAVHGGVGVVPPGPELRPLPLHLVAALHGRVVPAGPRPPVHHQAAIHLRLLHALRLAPLRRRLRHALPPRRPRGHALLSHRLSWRWAVICGKFCSWECNCRMKF